MSQQKILGDYQTPIPLAHQILSKLFSSGKQWKRILEPTCGEGNFIRALADINTSAEEIIGLDIQRDYVESARQIVSENIQIKIYHLDIFETNLHALMDRGASHPLLVVGNPPWVTNSTLGSLNGTNVPTKSNFQNLSGLDALTGKSNFDIAEFIWLKLLHEFRSESVTLALLCKTSVARKVLKHIYQQNLPASGMALYHIDSKKWFDVAVDAGLFVVDLNQRQPLYEVPVYQSLESQQPCHRLGFVKQKLVADLSTYQGVSWLDGQCSFEWRQGVKHDVSKVMELSLQDGHYVNGYHEIVDIEQDYIYPLIKSSDVKNISAQFQPRKYVIVTQKRLQQNTSQLQHIAPKLWNYLNLHSDAFGSRKSSIYQHAPPFSMFGIGDYSFAPYKVIVSGFYLPAKFALISTYNDKTYLSDDTCYFLSFDTAWEALVITALLNHPQVAQFIDSIVFKDTKRPITKSLLSRIGLKPLFEAIEFEDLLILMDKLREFYNLEVSLPSNKQQIQSLFGHQLQLL